MNTIYKFISILLIYSLLASCSSTQKIQVSGIAGTEIYTPDRTKVGTIGATGTVEISLNSDAYYAYLLSKNSASDKYIPFALDYKNYNYTGTKLAIGVCTPLFYMGCSTILVGGLGCAIASSEEDNASVGEIFGTMAGLGALAALVGLPAFAAKSRMEQVDHAYQFKYLKEQTTNNDLTFTKPQLTIVNKSKKEPKEVTKVTDNTPTISSSKSTKRLNNKSTKSFKNHGSNVEGLYVGTGTLTLGNEVIETYDDIIVKITRIDNSSVEVIVTESNGDNFFSESSVYNITKSKNNTYTLTHEDISKATITIDKNNKAIYFHPRVNIDNEIYTLKINATLKK